MAEKELKEKEVEKSGIPYEDIRYVQKYGLPKEEFEKSLQDDLKFYNSFWVIASYLQWARSLIEEKRVKECGHFIERAKYLLKGCKE